MSHRYEAHTSEGLERTLLPAISTAGPAISSIVPCRYYRGPR